TVRLGRREENGLLSTAYRRLIARCKERNIDIEGLADLVIGLPGGQDNGEFGPRDGEAPGIPTHLRRTGRNVRVNALGQKASVPRARRWDSQDYSPNRMVIDHPIPLTLGEPRSPGAEELRAPLAGSFHVASDLHDRPLGAGHGRGAVD